MRDELSCPGLSIWAFYSPFLSVKTAWGPRVVSRVVFLFLRVRHKTWRYASQSAELNPNSYFGSPSLTHIDILQRKEKIDSILYRELL